jgi:beta-glucosidase/6-phospho-beta-glucosidase/beta-galactosidase
MSAPAEGAKEIFITENGCASDDAIADDGNIYERNGFSTSHVARGS